MRPVQYFILLFCMIFGSVNAIVIRHDVDDAQYQKLGQTIIPLTTFYAQSGDQSMVVGSGTYVGHSWVVTAAHVAHYLKIEDKAMIKGEGFAVDKVFIHPQWKEGAAPNDIALIRLKGLPAKMPEVRLYNQTNETGKVVLFAGRGDFGNGNSGITGADNVLRGAENKIERVTQQWLIFNFDKPGSALPLEGISGPGDSGGPALVYEQGVYWLMGVSAWQNAAATQWQQGKYNVTEYYSRISTFSPWLQNIMRTVK